MPAQTKPKTNAKPTPNGQAPNAQAETPDLAALLGEEATRLVSGIARPPNVHSPAARLRAEPSFGYSQSKAGGKTGEAEVLDAHTCEISGYGFALPKGSPVPTLAYEVTRGSDDDTDTETITVHPGLFARGPEAIKEALEDCITHYRQEAVWLLERAAEFERLHDQITTGGLRLAWPDYWLDGEADGQADAGALGQGLRGAVHRDFVGLRI